MKVGAWVSMIGVMCECVEKQRRGEARTHGLQDFANPLTEHTFKRHCSNVNTRDTGGLLIEIGGHFHAWVRGREGMKIRESGR